MVIIVHLNIIVNVKKIQKDVKRTYLTFVKTKELFYFFVY